MAAKPQTDWGFLLDRVTPEALFEDHTDDVRRALIDLLRSDVPLRRGFRDWLACIAEPYFFPRSKPQKRRTKRQFQASLIRWKTETIRRSEGCSKTEAENKVAALLVKKNNPLGFTLAVKKKSNGAAVEALQQRLKRARRESRKRDKNF
jgi:hypothetical protein